MDKMNSSSVKNDNMRSNDEGELIFCNTEDECYGNNGSWDHCHHGEWIQLYMRLGMFPDEACKVTKHEKWSILHEACSSVVYDDDAEQTTKNGGIRKQSLSSSTRKTFKHNNVVSPMVLRAIHFACPPSRMLQESRNGETPLHCAIQEQHQTQQIMSLSSSNEEETTTNSDDTGEDGGGCQQQQDENVVDVIQAILQMSLDEDFEEDDDYDDMGVVMEVTTDEDEYCCAVVDDITNNDDSRASPTPVRRITSIQNNMGDTPFLKACRVGCSVNVFVTLMENTPKHYLTQPDLEGLYPLQRLWTELMHKSSNNEEYKSRIEKISKWDDLANDIELHSTWDKSVMLLRKLYSPGNSTLSTSRTDHNTPLRDWNSVGSPRLDFPIIRAIASNDSFGDLMKLAITLYPEEQVFTDAQGNNAVSEAVVARLSSHPEGSLGNIHLREVLMVLQQNEDLGTLLNSQMNTIASTKYSHAIGSAAVLPQADITSEGASSLHAAILEGKGWTNDIEALCIQNPNALKERFPGTFMFPFMLAATVNKTSTGKAVPDEDITGLVFELLRNDPTLIENDSSSPHNLFEETLEEDEEEIENFYFSGDKRKTTDQNYSEEEGTKRQACDDESTANEI